ncbi:hypothetical protein RF11_01221 [Thelohanellus kitauei]|uniref:Uncharacterized protein n=1 Tax=Thelohanellus kitauei TaxID=669202 RepID=A0A0C2MS49_THEKT|nr:hypothetical protein RF11_01221 [Thelohanellus kitauei]
MKSNVVRRINYQSVLNSAKKLKHSKYNSFKDAQALKARYEEIENNMNNIKSSIFDISLRSDPYLVNKMGSLFHEHTINRQIDRNLVDFKSLISIKSLFRDRPQHPQSGWVKVGRHLVKLNKRWLDPYPFIAFKDRIEPQKSLDPEIEAIFKSVYRYWDGKKWIKATTNYSQLSKLKEYYVVRGFEWPDLAKRDLNLQPPILPNPSPRVLYSSYNTDYYRVYIRKVMKLARSVSRTSRHIRDEVRDVASAFIYPNIKKLGYSYNYLKYSKSMPTIRNKVEEILTNPKYGKFENLKKLSSRMDELIRRRTGLTRLKETRNELFKNLYELNTEREFLVDKMMELGLLSSKPKKIIQKAASERLLNKIENKQGLVIRKSVNTPKTYKVGHTNYPLTLYHIKKFREARIASKIHPDRIREVLTNRRHYNEQRDAFLGRIKTNLGKRYLPTKEKLLRFQSNRLKRHEEKMKRKFNLTNLKKLRASR